MIYAHVRWVLFFVFITFLGACGGGGVTEPPQGNIGGSVTPEPTATPNVPSPGEFSVEQTRYAATFSEYENSYVTWDISGGVSRADEGLFIFADLSQSILLESAEVTFNEEALTGTLVITSVESNTLLPGTYYETITINACTTPDCHRHYTGSPLDVDMLVSVLPNTNADVNCIADVGVVFQECVPSPWLGVAAWEMSADGNFVQIKHMDGNNPDRLINWDVIASDDPERGNVLDITYNQLPGNGSLRFPAEYNALQGMPVANMSAFALGTIEFDIRVLDWGQATDLKAHVECFWPCVSQNIELNVPVINEWQHISLSLSELEEGGLNLVTVSTGLLIEPTWDAMAGLHYQLDNVRWLPGSALPLSSLHASDMKPEIQGTPAPEFQFVGIAAYVTPGWNSAADTISLFYTLEEPVDFSSRIGMNLTVQIPQNTAGSGVKALLFVRDNQGREARGLSTNLGDFAGKWLELTLRNYTLDADESFDVTRISFLGVRLFHDSEPVDPGSDTFQFNDITFRRY